MNWIKINFKALTGDLTPPKLRQKKELDWNYALTKNIRDLQDTINVYRDDTLYEILHNGQIMSLEHYLNDRLQPSGGTIYIRDYNNRIDETFIYGVSEILTTDLDTFIFGVSETGIDETFIFGDAEIISASVDFIVIMSYLDYSNPTFLSLLKSKVNEYKLGGMVYQINEY